MRLHACLAPNIAAEGVTNPPIDELLTKTDSKYKLVLYSAKRARQINAYYSQLGEGLLEYVGPLVDTHVQEKPLSIALREINADLLTCEDVDPAELAAEEEARKQASLEANFDAASDLAAAHAQPPPDLEAVPVGSGLGSSSGCPAASRRTRPASCCGCFTESGHDVTVVPTEAALRFVGAPTWAALSGKPVHTGVWDDVHEVPHVRIGQSADLVVVAPATADLLARAAHGLADDLLTNTLLTARCPVVLRPGDAHRDVGAPGDHRQRRHAARARRRRRRARRGPADRRRHRQGPAARARRRSSSSPRGARPGRDGSPAPTDLAGRHVVVSAGGTREPLDPVRFLGNRSSGRQGYALARAAAARGAEVTLVSANVALPDPAGVKVVRVETTGQLRDAVVGAAATADAVVMAAAPADFRPGAVSERQDQEVRRRLRADDRARAEPRHPRRDLPRPGPARDA